MKRSHYIIGGLALAISMPSCLQAQTTQPKDTTMTRTVVVEQEYNPDIMDASKVNVLPKVEEPTVSKKEVEYATTFFPATSVPAGLMRPYTGKEVQPGTADDENMMEMALIENIQREDLNAVEIALAYQHLLDQYELTQERLSERIGKKRTTIANYLRLLKLPAPIQMALQNKQLDMGHARALISLGDPKLQVKIFEEIQEHGYSVRKVEEIVKSLSEGEAVKSGTRKITPKRGKLPEEFNLLKQQLSGFFNTKVQLTCSEKGKGKISIPFGNEEELERIMEIFDTLKK